MSIENSLELAYSKKWSGFDNIDLDDIEDIKQTAYHCYLKQLVARWGNYSADQIDVMNTEELRDILQKKEVLYSKSRIIKEGKLAGRDVILKEFVRDINS